MSMTSEGTTFYMMRVLIVDDDPTSVATLKNCFQSQGCLFKVVTSGKQAVHELSTHNYNLVILDWKMPDMNGGETLVAVQSKIDSDAALKTKWANRKTPVLIYTGYHIKDVKFPTTANFVSVGVWDKLTAYRQLLPKAADILAKLAAQNERRKAA
ncbi:MAG: response regulator [Bdellovibrionia bacterium]